jgi:hypothetical protein
MPKPLEAVLSEFNAAPYLNSIKREEGREYTVDDLENVFDFLDNSGLIKSYTLLQYRLKQEYPGVIVGRALAILYCRAYPHRFPTKFKSYEIE